MKKTTLFLVLALIFSAPAYAHRPFTTEDAGVLDPLKFELEAGHDCAYVSDDEENFSGIYTLNAGILPRLEADFTVPVFYYLDDTEHTTGGFGDLDLLTKLRLTGETKYLPAWTLASGVTFPSGNERHGIGSAKAAYQVMSVFSKEIKRLTTHLNLGWNFLNGEEDQLVVNTAFNYALTEKWGVLAEWDMGNNVTRGRDGETNGVLFGFLWKVHPRVTLDAAYRFATIKEDADHTITTGATIGM